MVNPEPGSIPWSNVAIAFFVVAGLLALMGFVLKYISLRGLPGSLRPARSGQRLKVVESLPLDIRRRLVIVRCDDTDHLLLLGLNQDIVVELNLGKETHAPTP